MNTWISKKLLPARREVAAAGYVNAAEGNTVVMAAAEQTGALLAPYGLRYRPAAGARVLLLPVGDGVVCAGELCGSGQLAPGELAITMPSGAGIYLKNNGEVVINGRVRVAPDGTVTAKKFVTE